MVNSILQYIEPQLKAYMQFLNRVDSPVFRISNGEMIKGNGQEKEVVTISDLNGNSLYIRQTQPETINERKALSSCDKEYNISARCKVVFYSFGGNDFTINPDKVKSKIINTLSRLDFSHYAGSSTEIKIDINGNSLDMEKIYTEETGKEFSGNVWPTLVTVDFTLSYVDTNCNSCDIDDNETVITWTPDLTPENCETKAICEVISKCDVITLLQEQTASLQEQIDNLPQSGLTCTDLPNCQTIIDILQSINDIVSGLPSSYFSCGDLAVCQTIIDIVSDISALQTQVGTNTTDISTLQGQVSSLISDLGTLTTTVNNHISDTSNPHNVTLEQARSENSSISGDINANNNTIINLKDAVNPQEPITKIQFDTYVSAVGGNRGAIDCSANPNYPASNKGDRWEVTVAGKIGGPSGINVDVYDEIVCVTASASGDQATVGVNFYIVQGNIERATETTNGYTSYATDAEVQAGTENTKSLTSLKLANWWVNIKTLAHTFAAKITFTSAPRFNSTTANQHLEVDSNKELISVANESGYNLPLGITAGTVLEGNSLNYVTPEMYGAVGDGVTDDYLAITNAVNSGLPVYFHNKTYKVNSQITVDNSSAMVIIYGNNAKLLSGISSVGLSIFRIYQANKIFITNLNFNFNASATAHYGLRLGDNAGSKYVGVARITNCDFYNFGVENQRGMFVENTPFVSGLLANFNLPSLLIDGCNFYNQNTTNTVNYTTATWYGIGIQLGELTDYCKITNCNFNFIRIAVWSSAGANLDITGCNFLGCLPKQLSAYTYGVIHVPNTGTNNGKINVVGCKFNHNYGYCFYYAYATAERPVTISDCHFIANSTTIFYATHTAAVATRHRIVNNYFERCSQAYTNSWTGQPFGATLQPFIYLNNQTRCLVRLNTFLNDGTYGVTSANSADYNIVKNNSWFNITGVSSLVGANNQTGDNDNL